MRCTRLFVSILMMSFSLPVVAQEKSQQNNTHAKLERHLWQIEQQWLRAEHNQKLDFLSELWADQFFDVLSGGLQITKEDMLKRLARATPKPESGGFPDDFKLIAEYGNVGLATDHTTIKGMGSVDGQYRALRMFVKEDGEWKVAGAALVRIVAQ
ncbi:MAG: nuclear transport factor 2 family protein [Candidatus Acidiferrales bacterium]